MKILEIRQKINRKVQYGINKDAYALLPQIMVKLQKPDLLLILLIELENIYIQQILNVLLLNMVIKKKKRQDYYLINLIIF